MLDLTVYTNNTSIRRRFYKHVDFCEHGKRCKQCCWLWHGASAHGYGTFYLAYKLHNRAHRFMYVLRYGHTDLQVNHVCDNRLCVNYNHLYAGTQKENMQDRESAGKTLRGEKHGSAYLTNEDIYHIFYMRDHGYLLREIADLYGVSQGHVSRILSGKKWNHLKESL